MRLRRAPNKRSQRYSDNARHAKDRHGNTPLFVALPNVGQSPRDNINADRARAAAKEPRHDQSREIGSRGRRDEPDEKQDVAGEVAGHAADVLGQRHEEEREDCCADVPRCGCPVEPGEVGLTDAKFGGHLSVAGAVGAGGESS